MEDFLSFSHDIKFTYEFAKENTPFLDLKFFCLIGNL